MYHIVIRQRSSDPDSDVSEPAKERKERVIHTRVPESLEAELRQKAEDLGISVSNLVRNVLGHAFGLVGDVVADSHAIARAARSVAGRPAAASSSSSSAPPVSTPVAQPARGPEAAAGVSAAGPLPPIPVAPPPESLLDDVLAWQSIVLGKNAVCLRCNALLPRGSDAAIGVAESTGARLVICAPCLAALRA